LKNLKSLTVHGNPVVWIPNFRYYFIAMFPNLKKLDTVLITKKERDNTRVWTDTFGKKKYPSYEGLDCARPPEIIVKKDNKDENWKIMFKIT